MTDEKELPAEETKPEITVEIDAHELMVRIFEGMAGVKRPEGFTLEQCVGAIPLTTMPAIRQAAQNALNYFLECAQSAKKDEAA